MISLGTSHGRSLYPIYVLHTEHNAWHLEAFGKYLLIE